MVARLVIVSPYFSTRSYSEANTWQIEMLIQVVALIPIRGSIYQNPSTRGKRRGWNECLHETNSSKVLARYYFRK